MRKNVIRICLDTAMALLLVLMYKKAAISIDFHEIGGLVVGGLFVIHNLLNRKWIVGISRRMFGGKLAPRVRIGYVVDVLLLTSMAFIAVSGIMISQTILTGISGSWPYWKLAHYFAAALALVLFGVHIGLHWSFIRTTFARRIRLPRVVARPLAIALLAAILIYGGYIVATTSFTGWLADPFTVLVSSSDEVALTTEGRGGGQGTGRHGSGSSIPGGVVGVVAAYGSIAAMPAALTVLVETTAKKRKQPKHVLQPA